MKDNSADLLRDARSLVQKGQIGFIPTWNIILRILQRMSELEEWIAAKADAECYDD